MRNLLALSLAALAACSYSEEKAGITVRVDGVPQGADHLEVKLTDAANASLTRTPVFGATASPSVDVLFPGVAAGAFHTSVEAKNRDGSTLAQGSADGAFPGQTSLQITLRSSGLIGTYAAPCSTAGGSPAACTSGLECRSYAASDVGVCTHTCAAATPDCDGASPAAVCATFPGLATKYCQWDCTAAGQSACPTGTTCRAAASSGGKSYCQGT